jgi:hypothetical protein
VLAAGADSNRRDGLLFTWRGCVLAEAALISCVELQVARKGQSWGGPVVFAEGAGETQRFRIRCIPVEFRVSLVGAPRTTGPPIVLTVAAESLCSGDGTRKRSPGGHLTDALPSTDKLPTTMFHGIWFSAKRIRKASRAGTALSAEGNNSAFESAEGRNTFGSCRDRRNRDFPRPRRIGASACGDFPR